MKKLSTKQFWITLFSFHILTSIIIINFVYTQQEEKITQNLKEILVSKVERLNYQVSLAIDQRTVASAIEFLDSSCALDPLVQSLSIGVGNKTILLSSNRHYKNKPLTLFQTINFDDFKDTTEPTFRQIIHSDLKTFTRLPNETHYSLLIELDQHTIQEMYRNTFVQLLSTIFLLSLGLFLTLIFTFYRLYMQPIHRINTKIATNQLIKDDFLVDELRYLDTTIIENSIHIHSSNFLLHSLINATDDLIFFKDKNFNYLGCNEAFLLFVGKSKEEMVGHSDFELFNLEMATLFREMDVEMLKENKTLTDFEWVTYPDGRKVYLQTQKIPFHYNENKIGVLGISRDLTQLHLAQKELKKQSYIDPLTKTNNRRSYQKKFTKLIALHERYKTPFSVIMYDIDDFKKINDTYGHNVGDKVLIEMSALVQSTLRVNDTLCRIGGEEFIILLPETSQESALRVAEKIRSNVENELHTIENKSITISLGVCEVRESDTEDTLFIRVDGLLYESKRNGKNRVTSL